MPAELTILDWGWLGATAVLVVVGGYLGVSSQLGALAAFVVAPLVAYAFWGVANAAVAMCGLADGIVVTVVAVIVDLIVVLVASGLVRMMVKKFVRGCLGGCVNALAGALVGLSASLALLALMVGVGVTRPGAYARGFCSARSSVVHVVATWLDTRFRGGNQ